MDVYHSDSKSPITSGSPLVYFFLFLNALKLDPPCGGALKLMVKALFYKTANTYDFEKC